MKNKETCAMKHCRNNIAIFYYKIGLCNQCWDKLAQKPVEEMKRILGIKKHDAV